MYKRVQLLIFLLWTYQFAFGAEKDSLVGNYSAHIQAGYSIWFELRKDKSASFNTWASGDDGGQGQQHEEIGFWVLKNGVLSVETEKDKYFVFEITEGKVLDGKLGYILDIHESSLPPDDLVMSHRYYYGQSF